jgi:predicted metal-binding protein
MKKYVVIIQCDIAHNRCSGFACTNGFYNKVDKFESYAPETQYISFTCGGCSGKGVAAKLEHFSKKIRKQTDIKKEEITVHLASCITTDNYHSDRCPHAEYIKSMVLKKGYKDIIEGTYISKNAENKRAAGIYNTY